MNPTPLRLDAEAAAISAFLLARDGWVAGEEICQRFGVEARALRATNTVPGLCSQFAISGPKGFRHITTCPEEEWRAFEARMKAHGIAELVRVKNLRARRQQAKPQLELNLL